MEAPNIQLYNLFRQDLHLPDGKSLERMHLLDKEYKSGVKEDIPMLAISMDGRFAEFAKTMDARFEKVDARFEKVDARFEKVDARFDRVDARFEAIENRLDTHDKRFDELDNKIDKSSIKLDNKIDTSSVKLDGKIDKCFGELGYKIDKCFSELGNKIDRKSDEVRIELKDTRVEITRWMFAIILTLAVLLIGMWFKK